MATFRIYLGQWAKDLERACLDVEKAFDALTHAVPSFNENPPALKMQIGITMRYIDWPKNSCSHETIGYIGWDTVLGENIESPGGGE